MGDMSYHEFDIPREASETGRLEVGLVPKSEIFPVTGMAEIWLMRRENVPWRAPAPEGS
jgi:hypothetical protein